MMRATLILILVAGCAPVMSTEELTRSAARSVVTRSLVARYPDLPVEPVLNCVIDNATQAELVGLASDSVTGPTAATAANIAAISSRPETLACLAQSQAFALPT